MGGSVEIGGEIYESFFGIDLGFLSNNSILLLLIHLDPFVSLQVFESSPFEDASLFEHKDLIAVHDGPDAMCYRHCSLFCCDFIQSGLDVLFIPSVEG